MPKIPPIAIEVEQLHKVFSTSIGFWRRDYKTTTAVDGISFSVRSGELFGLLGPNGAGKTTTIKMLSTLLLPTSGLAHVLGLDVVKDVHRLRHKIGFTFGGGRGLYSRLSALDNLLYFAELYGLEPRLAEQRIAHLLDIMGLAGREQERVETYSSGMQQRLHLARVMLHDPDVLFLDEPTVGIDPVGARALRKTIKDLVALGKTILLTTHYMYEAEELCDRIAIINQGHIVELGTPANLKRRVLGETVIDVQMKQDGLLLNERLQPLNDCISLHTTHHDSHELISIRTQKPSAVMEALAPLLQQQMIEGLEVRNPTLEDVYVNIIQQGNNHA
jgi:ABC-2 type transport system ATP-binding protein